MEMEKAAKKDFDSLVKTLEVLLRAVRAENPETAYKAVTVALMQVLRIFEHVRELFNELFPKLELIKNQILSSDFTDAGTGTSALLMEFREICDNLGAEIRRQKKVNPRSRGDKEYMSEAEHPYRISPDWSLYRVPKSFPQDKAYWDKRLKDSIKDPKKLAEAMKFHNATWDAFKTLL